MMRILAILPIAATTLLCGCGGEVTEPSRDAGIEAGGACTKDSDCLSMQRCGFNVFSGCSAPGQCVVKDGPCVVSQFYCACSDGHTVKLACNANGFAPFPSYVDEKCSHLTYDYDAGGD